MILVLLLLADIICLATLLASSYDVVALAVFPALLGLGLVVATRGGSNDEKAGLARLFAISFLLRVGLAIALYRFGLVGLFGDEDSSGWYGGWQIAQAWKGDPQFAWLHPSLMEALRRSNQGYYYLAASLLYFLDSPSRISLAFVSAFAGGITTILVYRTAALIFGRESGERAGMLAAVFPSLVAWSSQTLKEPFVILFECAVVYAVFSLRARTSFRMVVFLLAALFGLYAMRFYAAYISALAALLILLWPTGLRGARAPLVGALIVSAAIVGLFGSGLWRTEIERLNVFNLARVQAFRVDVARGPGSGSGILLPYDVSTPQGALVSFPVSLLGFLLSPFPWQALEGSGRLKLAMVDVLLWWWLIPKVLAGVRTSWQTHRWAVSALMLFILPLTAFYALAFGNAGLAFRERSQILVLCLTFGGVGLIQRDHLRLSLPPFRLQTRDQ